MDLLLAGSAGVGHLAAGSLAGVAQGVAHLAADDGQVGDGVGRRAEAVLDGVARVAHAGAEDGQLVHGVVDLDCQPAEYEERQQG